MINDPVLYLEIDEFKVLLKSRVVEEGGIPGFSKRYGISRPLLYALLKGEREPSKALLKKLGARFVIAVDAAPKKKS